MYTLKGSCNELRAKQCHIPSERVFQALGSTLNKPPFVMYAGYLNGLKSRVRIDHPDYLKVHTYAVQLWRKWTDQAPYRDDLIGPFILACNKQHEKAFELFRNVYGVFAYLNHRLVANKWKKVAYQVRSEFQYIEEAWNKDNPTTPAYLSKAWTEWFDNLLEVIEIEARNWVEKWLWAMQQDWLQYRGSGPPEDPRLVEAILSHISYLLGRTSKIRINVDNLWVGGT